jgi:hypothetical protein
MEQNEYTHKQKTKQGNLHHYDNSKKSVSAIRLNIMQR